MIRRGELLRLTFLTDGPPKLIVSNPIADVDVREQSQKDGRYRVAAILVAAGFLTVTVTLIIAVVNQASNNGAIVALFIVALGYALAMSGGLIAAINAAIDYSARRKMRSNVLPPSSS